ncbi:uncharacterized protein B0H18DRAFT_532099 [Fomitopsis serialis]|uniref:uncharacterized protein n=1 Tax=Fomitopsis serialis TaxID=139415 RepID=UPI0020087576|nr:uncharacterized protein B0H18DRAFT_532099 [Neoantrodia serialis]KAH9921871.1 hypothetical protein B0H18DRAFT_532099 [Neoantrodia serialis]
MTRASTEASTTSHFPGGFIGRLKRIPASRRGEKIAMYLALRLAPEYYLDGPPMGTQYIVDVLQHLALPKGAAVERAEDRRLRSASQQKAMGNTHEVYEVHACRLGLRRPDLDSERVYAETILNFVDDQNPNGLRMLLDTGASVTRLPLPFVQQINDKLVRADNMIKPPEAGVKLNTYRVPQWMGERKIQVAYEFEGENGKTVKIYGPFETFFYQHDINYIDRPMEGLIFPQRASCDHGVFGLNFFQTMYVSLHKATHGVDFVRMAAQWPEDFADDMENYHVAGLSGT